MKELDKNKPVQTGAGRSAEIKYTFKNGYHFVVFPDNDGWDIFKPNGVFGSGLNTEYNLINVPERIKGWVNIYNKHIHPTKQDADNNAGKGCVACIYIDVPEGEGLK